jgi:tRNA (guanine10-N2)-methyltransferase
LNFNFLPFEGKVELSKPDVELWVVLDYTNMADVETVDDPQLPCYFGRLIARGGMREELKKYDLKKRLYLGPTSLDPALALIMSNMAGVQRGNVVFDPFVGTASILVAMSHFGAICFGADIDTRVLRGEMYAGAADKKVDDKKRDIFENFKEYGLEIPELVRMDNHLFDRHAVVCTDVIDSNGSVVERGMFDAIVTDPPYGIRAGAKKSGKRKQVDYTVPPERRIDHIPSTQHYPVEEVMLDLLHTAAKVLVK